MQTESFDTLWDVVGTFRPAKRRGVLVVLCGIAEQRCGEFLDTAMHAPAELALGQHGEPRFGLIQPRT
jgi:hypothetical protein